MVSFHHRAAIHPLQCFLSLSAHFASLHPASLFRAPDDVRRNLQARPLATACCISASFNPVQHPSRHAIITPSTATSPFFPAFAPSAMSDQRPPTVNPLASVSVKAKAAQLFRFREEQARLSGQDSHSAEELHQQNAAHINFPQTMEDLWKRTEGNGDADMKPRLREGFAKYTKAVEAATDYEKAKVQEAERLREENDRLLRRLAEIRKGM